MNWFFRKLSLFVKWYLEKRYNLPFNRIMGSFVIQDMTGETFKKIKKPLDKKWKVVFIDMTDNELYIFEKAKEAYQAAVWREQQVIDMISSPSMSEFENKIFNRLERRNNDRQNS